MVFWVAIKILYFARWPRASHRRILFAYFLDRLSAQSGLPGRFGAEVGRFVKASYQRCELLDGDQNFTCAGRVPVAYFLDRFSALCWQWQWWSRSGPFYGKDATARWAVVMAIPKLIFVGVCFIVANVISIGRCVVIVSLSCIRRV